MFPIKYINISDLILKPGDLIGYLYFHGYKLVLEAMKVVVNVHEKEVFVYSFNSRKFSQWNYHLMIENKGFYIRNSEIYIYWNHLKKKLSFI